MSILIATGAYKGTVSAVEASEIISSAIRSRLPKAEIATMPLADGGEGTLDLFQTHFDAKMEFYPVCGPSGDRVLAKMGFTADSIAVIESCQAVGLSLVKSNTPNPFNTTSYGLGELFRTAVSLGARKVIVTMGDSATMDLGLPMLEALGVRFFGKLGTPIRTELKSLGDIYDYDDSNLDAIRDTIEVHCLLDTMDFLCGPAGQVQLYGRQKGLSNDAVAGLETAYLQFAKLIKSRRNIDMTKLDGAAGSGGISATLHAFLNAEIEQTTGYLSRTLDCQARLTQSTVNITGEGCLDEQTRRGKIPHYVAANSPKRCVCIVGQYTQQGLQDLQNVCDDVVIVKVDQKLAKQNPKLALFEAAVRNLSVIDV